MNCFRRHLSIAASSGAGGRTPRRALPLAQPGPAATHGHPRSTTMKSESLLQETIGA
jgi:hypothetical protein